MNVEVKRHHWIANAPDTPDGYALFIDGKLIVYSASPFEKEWIDRRVGQYIREGK